MKSPARLQYTLGMTLALAALLAAPTAALGKEGGDLVFHLTGSNGYRIVVDGQGATAYISATRPSPSSRRRVAWSTYVARRKTSATAIRASFGDLGSVSMRFHPSGKVTYSKPHRDCRGPDRRTIRFGVFVGSVRFRGEGGYTSASAHRVKGKVITPPSLNCSGPSVEAGHRKGPRSNAGQGNARTTLNAGWRLGLTATYFTAAVKQGKVRFLAATEQSEGSFAVYRVVSELASPLTFAFDDALSFAAVTPPPPFNGTGSLQRDADGIRNWTGSLAVSFPGDENVPLSGPQFKTRLTRSW